MGKDNIEINRRKKANMPATILTIFKRHNGFINAVVILSRLGWRQWHHKLVGLRTRLESHDV